MHIGFAGRVSQQAATSFLLASDFFRAARLRVGELTFEGIPDGLIIGLDSFPADSPLSPQVKKARKLRNTLVRGDQGELKRLPSLHFAGMSLDHSRLLACKSEREVAALIASEVERQASEVFSHLAAFEYTRLCAELHSLAATMPAAERNHT